MATGNREVVDYSYSRIDLAEAAQLGIVGCMRYLYRNGKGLTPAEVDLFRRVAMRLGLNYEAGSGDFIGFAAGQSQARNAEQLAVELGLSGNTIAFSADWDVQAWQFQAVGDAVAGALSVLGDGKVAVYGHARLLAYLWGRFGTRIYYWQTYAWSGGYVSPYADLYQYLNGQDFAGGQVDYNDIRGRTFWAIGSNAHTTADTGGATPIQSEEDDDVLTITKTLRPGDYRVAINLGGPQPGGSKQRWLTVAVDEYDQDVRIAMCRSVAQAADVRNIQVLPYGWPTNGSQANSTRILARRFNKVKIPPLVDVIYLDHYGASAGKPGGGHDPRQARPVELVVTDY